MKMGAPITRNFAMLHDTAGL